MFGFKHTMNKLEHNTVDRKLVRTRLYARLLQVNGPGYLDKLFPFLQAKLHAVLQDEVERGISRDDNLFIPVAQTARLLASKLMAFVFYGDLLASDKVFSDALLRYPKDMIKCMAAFQLTPTFVSPIMHAILTNRGAAMHIIQGRLQHIMGPGKKAWNEPKGTKELTILHNMMEMTEDSDYWEPELLSQSLLGIWFAASHQPWMFLDFVLLELCAQPEAQYSLQEELDSHAPSSYHELERLPLLDIAIRRKALEPYTFSGGSPSVPQNGTVCVSAYNLMHDPHHYPEPNSFKAARFVPKTANDGQQKFTEISEKYPVWGYGSLACPGRFYASLVMKLIVSQILLQYNIRLENEKARTKWCWESFTMPYESTRIAFQERRRS
ncbi:cytochrome P450 [Lindgomyces ingoldianus]|uniref:Cytochrome P450 n=1 Tax=Lindgomyces ingoldianus TaxID=673940 RepID=A0ACB6QA19_9PLEO|nr:cytochrome P450 [Lindgomyces ingoldianus]KAF2463764.1 cytochrome P450 [Lindgomyces ingoldianus]